MTTEVYKDSTSHSPFFELVDSTTGLPKTGVLYTDVTASYARTRGARTAITPATLASASASWSNGGFILVDDTNQPGVYRFDVPNAAFATGVEEVVVTVKATGCRTVSRAFTLIDINKQTTKVPATIAAGDIATDAITAASVKADAVTKIQNGLSTLTQTQVTGGAYALNSASFAFNAALDFTATQKLATLARVTLVDTTTTNTDMRGTDNAALAATALSTAQWTNTLATNLGTTNTSVTAILADTNELQTDWANGGRLDLILDAAGAAGDPWSTTVPGAYGSGTAGYKFGNLPTSAAIAAALTDVGTVELIGPSLSGAAHKIVRGSAYLFATSTAPYVLVAKATYDLAGATAQFKMKLDRQTAVTVTATIVSYDATYWKVYADLLATVTDDMTPGTGHDQFWVTLSGGSVICLSQCYLEVIAGIGIA